MKNIKSKISFLTLTLLALVLVGCGRNSSQTSAKHSNKELAVTAQQALATADPAQAQDIVSQNAIAQFMEGLYTTNQSGKVVPAIATKIVQPTDNGKTYTINLRSDAKWANGQKVTAQDFVYSWQRLVNPKTKAQEVGHLIDVKNAEEINAGKKPLSSLGVKAVNSHQIQIKLVRKTPWFNYRLATQLYPINIAAAKKYGSKYGTSATKTVSNGAYQLKDWNGTSDTWKYQRNNDYYAKNSVKIHQIHVQTVKTNNTAQYLFDGKKVQITQITGNQVQQAKNGSSKKNLVINKNNQMYFLPWNSKRKTTANENLRRAVSLSIDRQSLVKNVLKDGSVVAKSIVTQGDFKNPTTGKDFNDDTGNLYQLNKAEARKYWAKAQKQLGKKSVSIQLLTSDVDANKQVGEYIQNAAETNLKGLKVTIKAVPLSSEINTLSSGNFDFATLAWSSDYQDPVDFLNKASMTSSVNFGKYNNPAYEKMINTITDDNQSAKDRYATMQKAAKYLAKVQGVTPLYQTTSAHLVNSQLGGVHFTLLRDALYRYAYWK